MVNTRLAKLSEALQASGLDALALNAGSSLTYLTGLHFHLSERPVVAIFTTDHAPVIVLPELEILKVSGQPYLIESFPYGENPADWDGVFRKAVLSLGLDGKHIGGPCVCWNSARSKPAHPQRIFRMLRGWSAV